jgi:hypothetical protein
LVEVAVADMTLLVEVAVAGYKPDRLKYSQRQSVIQ